MNRHFRRERSERRHFREKGEWVQKYRLFYNSKYSVTGIVRDKARKFYRKLEDTFYGV